MLEKHIISDCQIHKGKWCEWSSEKRGVPGEQIKQTLVLEAQNKQNKQREGGGGRGNEEWMAGGAIPPKTRTLTGAGGSSSAANRTGTALNVTRVQPGWFPAVTRITDC